MITAKVPLRVSFFGGGTDIPQFYKKNKFGCVLSSTINQYLYISVKKHGKFHDEKYRFNYSQSERCNSINKIQNNIFREVIKHFNIKDNLYISTISDIPTSSGLGSSSALVVGLFIIFNKLYNLNIPKKKLIEDAAQFEIKKISNSIGKQDHYSTFNEGIKFIKFNYNEKVLTKKTNFLKFKKNIGSNLLFFWTGIQRNANTILKTQNKNIRSNISGLIKLRNITEQVFYKLKKNKIDIVEFGKYLHESWKIKSSFSNKISNNFIDNCYLEAIKNGGLGGKILGAGGGGFLMIIAKKKNHRKIIKKLSRLGLNNIEIELVNDKAKLY